MKKIVLAAGVIVVLAALGSPFISGMVMEKVVRDSFADLNQRYAESGQDVRAEIVRYDRGFGSSEIEWRISSEGMKAFAEVGEVVFIDQAEHGLSGITTSTSLTKNGWYADFVNSRLGGKDPLHITTTYRYNGDMRTAVSLEPFTIQEGQDTVAVRAGQLAVAFAQEFKGFSAEGSWEGMEVADNVSLAGISFKSDLAMISPYIWDGKMQMAMQGGRAKGENEFDTLEVAALKIDTLLDYDEKRKKLAASAEYSAESLVAGTEKIGNIFARLGVKELDAPRYEEFMKLYTETMRHLFAEIAAAKNDPQKMQEVIDRQMANIGFQLVAAGEKLMTQGLEFQLSDLNLQVPEGPIKGNVLVRLKKDLTFAQVLPVVNQPKLALGILELKSAFSLPGVLAGDAPLMFSPIYPGMQTGFFVQNGDIVSHSAETRDDKLFLNDKEVLLQ